MLHWHDPCTNFSPLYTKFLFFFNFLFCLPLFPLSWIVYNKLQFNISHCNYIKSKLRIEIQQWKNKTKGHVESTEIYPQSRFVTKIIVQLKRSMSFVQWTIGLTATSCMKRHYPLVFGGWWLMAFMVVSNNKMHYRSPWSIEWKIKSGFTNGDGL